MRTIYKIFKLGNYTYTSVNLRGKPCCKTELVRVLIFLEEEIDANPKHVYSIKNMFVDDSRPGHGGGLWHLVKPRDASEYETDVFLDHFEMLLKCSSLETQNHRGIFHPEHRIVTIWLNGIILIQRRYREHLRRRAQAATKIQHFYWDAYYDPSMLLCKRRILRWQ
jgi:hypothetical protein